MTIIPFQTPLRPAIPTVRGNIEYRRLEGQLRRMDEILQDSGIEKVAIEKSIAQYVKRGEQAGIVEVKTWHLKKHQQRTVVALRCMVLKSMLGVSCREMSIQLAQSQLYQWFCRLGRIDEVRVPSKSTIQGFIDIISEEDIAQVVMELLKKVSCLSLKQEVDLEKVWFDSTCIKANIHYPVDWVLLRDAVRTLIKAVIVIRKHGVKSRMSNPSQFLTRINTLCMQMTQCRRKKDSKKRQKKILRLMKELVTTVRKHAERHYELLDAEWERSDLSRKQAELILRRIMNVLEQLPLAQKQAHERIIGERKVDNKDKLLSLYENQTNVIIRGKANAEVEFGNTFLLAEQSDGLIVDWKFFKGQAPSDSALLKNTVLHIQYSLGIKIKALGADRGFDSEKNKKFLDSSTIFNGITPKDSHLLQEKRADPEFVMCQKRRASTEARIGIFKNCFLGKILKTKGFENRSSSIAWAVLAHNLWVLAKLPVKENSLKLAA